MPLGPIPPVSTTPISPIRRDERTASKAKPPDVEAGITGMQVHAVARQEERSPDDPPSEHIDITI